MTSEPSWLGSRATDDTLQPETEPEKEDVGFQFNDNIHQAQSQLRPHPQGIHPLVRHASALGAQLSLLDRTFDRIQVHAYSVLVISLNAKRG